MKKFVGKLILLLCIFGVIVTGLDIMSALPQFRQWFAYVTESEDYPAGSYDETRKYLDQIWEEGPYTKLLLGDSVCYQMTNGLREYNQEYSLVGNNQALTLAGEYLLVREFFETHEGVTDVYLMVGVDELRANVNVTLGYQYVVIPFVREGLIGNLEEETIEQMESNFGAFFMQRPIAMLVGCSSVNRKLYLNFLKDYTTPYYGEQDALSSTTCIYLPKIYELCEENGATLHLIPDPLADNDWRHQQVEELEADFAAKGFDELFPNYFDEIVYYPEEQFLDGVHFGEPYNTQEEFNRKLTELYLDKGYLEGLVLEP